MTARSAKSADGRVEYVYEKGRLTEIGPYLPKFTLSAIDTQVIKNLLCPVSDEIDMYAEKALLAIAEEVE